MDLIDIQTLACGAYGWFQQALIRLCVYAAVALIAVLVLRTQAVRDVAARIAALWRDASHWMRLAALTLLSVCILSGGEKMRSGNGPLGERALSIVTAEEIAQGWRLVAETNCEADVYAMPEGITPSFNWHKRGTFGEWARLDLGDFAFPLGTNDETVTSFSVFNDGRIRPTPRDAAREICAVGVPMLAMQGASRFWVGEAAGTRDACPYRVKLLTWENFFLNADTNTPINAQIELVANGDFVTRSNDVERIYRRVEPFDWDGDGLENTVDPNPLVAGADAHGTNAEWYNVVCSNVLEAVEGDGSAGTPRPTLSWLEGVNSNAYYFVDVVTTNGLAPIYFTGDRESRLGNPVVVARAFETNHVPLLIGVNYAVTSPVPFTVSIPDDGFTSVTTNTVSNYAVQWPLEFTVAPDGTGYRVSAGPYDPGCVFQWAEPTRSVACSYTTDGGWIGFNCCGIGVCGCSGCAVAGVATLESASFDIPSVWCGCWHFDPLELGYGMFQTNTHSVSVSFDKSVVFYEDAYTNAPNDVVAKHSTNTTLTVFACGGESGGTLYVTAQNIGKLSRTGGSEIDFPYVAFVPPHGCVSFSITYAAETHSDSEGDIFVSAAIFPHEGEIVSDSASVTAVKIDFKPEVHLSRFLQHRHVVGVNELAQFTWKPNSVSVGLRANGGGQVHDNNGYYYYRAPLIGVAPDLVATCQYSEFELAVSIIEPVSVVVTNVFAYNYNVSTNDAGGAGMGFDMYILPTNVSFMNIAVMEVPSEYMDPQGYFAKPYFDYAWAHTTNMSAGVWHNIGIGNFFMQDCAEMGDLIPRITPDGGTSFEPIYGWIAGSMNWRIPVGWNCRNSAPDDPALKEFMVYWQSFRMSIEGTLEVEKLSNTVQRATNSVIRLNGGVQTLGDLRLR